jgi:hypothetical protein
LLFCVFSVARPRGSGCACITSCNLCNDITFMLVDAFCFGLR